MWSLVLAGLEHPHGQLAQARRAVAVDGRLEALLKVVVVELPWHHVLQHTKGVKPLAYQGGVRNQNMSIFGKIC